MLTLEPLPMEGAQEFWRDKIRLSPSQINALSDEAKLKAFAVSGIAKGAELETVYDAMQNAIDKGNTFADFKKDAAAVFEKRGWTGAREFRIETIFRTNIQTAYSVGRYKEMMEVSKTRPYWQYHAVNDSRTRPTHAALNGKVFRYDNEFWDKWYPPNGFNCRCTVTTLSQDDVDSEEIKVETKDPTYKLIEPIDPATGNRMPARPLIPDRGFDFNPGKTQWGERLPDDEFKKLQSDPERWTALIKKDFSNYERQSAKDIEDYKETEKALWGVGEKAVLQYKKNLMGKVIKDAVNDPVAMNENFIEHLKLDGRERFLPLIEDIVTNPYEIWLQAEKEKETGKVVLRKRYIDFIKTGKERPMLFIAEAGKGQWLGYTFFYTRDAEYIDAARNGVLLYKKKK